MFGQHCQAQRGTVGVSCAGPEAALADPCGSVPTQNIPWLFGEDLAGTE